MTIDDAKNLPNCIPIQLHRYYDYIDAIYASRDKEICENCKWYADIGKSYKECELYRISHGDDYGCNRWESKTVSTDT